jgi:hypothetical protein
LLFKYRLILSTGSNESSKESSSERGSAVNKESEPIFWVAPLKENHAIVENLTQNVVANESKTLSNRR